MSPRNEKGQFVAADSNVVEKVGVWNVERPFGLERQHEITEELRRAADLRTARLRDWDELKDETKNAKSAFEEADVEMMKVVKILTKNREQVERPVIFRYDYDEKTFTAIDAEDGTVYEERPLRESEYQTELDLDVDPEPPKQLATGEIIDAEIVDDDDAPPDEGSDDD